MALEALHNRMNSRCAVGTMTTMILVFWLVYFTVSLSEYYHHGNNMTFIQETFQDTNDYIIQYLPASKTAILIDKKSYQPLMLTTEALKSVKNFTESCVQCKYVHQCSIREHRTITVQLEQSTDQVLTVFDFQKCSSSDNCHWFGQYFACSDLITISSLIP
jgi:hypothetical protein